jgi:dephospho-CoA kinase
MLLIGLTGGIASGKSLVSGQFAELGVPVLDADVLAREVVQPGTAGLAALVDHFTPSILTPEGELDRRALRKIVFASPPERQFLDNTLHPLIRQLSDQRIEEARRKHYPYLVYAVPLLVETQQQNRFDRVLVVDVPESVQLERLVRRDNTSEEEARAILASQATRASRLAVADDVIDNNGSTEDLRHRVESLHRRYLELATNASTIA